MGDGMILIIIITSSSRMSNAFTLLNHFHSSIKLHFSAMCVFPTIHFDRPRSMSHEPRRNPNFLAWSTMEQDKLERRAADLRTRRGGGGGASLGDGPGG